MDHKLVEDQDFVSHTTKNLVNCLVFLCFCSEGLLRDTKR